MKDCLFSDIFQSHQSILQKIFLNWFAKHLVHSIFNHSLHVWLFNVASATADYWLLYAFFEEILSDGGCCFVSVHYWHLKVHQNQTEVGELSIIWFNISFDVIQSLKSILCFNNCIIDVFNSNQFNYHLKRHSVECFIVNN